MVPKNTADTATASTAGNNNQYNHRRSGGPAGRSSRPARNAVSSSNTNASSNRISGLGGKASHFLNNHMQANPGQSSGRPAVEISSAVLSRKVNMIMFGHGNHGGSGAGIGTAAGNARY